MMQCQILLVFHKGIQGNLEGESSSLSEVTKSFFQAPIQQQKAKVCDSVFYFIYLFIYLFFFDNWIVCREKQLLFGVVTRAIGFFLGLLLA